MSFSKEFILKFLRKTGIFLQLLVLDVQNPIQLLANVRFFFLFRLYVGYLSNLNLSL